MSTTRRAPKRKRVQRRIENDQLRTARRDSLSILLSRAQRGVLSRDEAALLRTHVETELAEADATRQSERGQQRAMDRERRRVEAAEQAIAELERDLADMNRDRDRWREAAGLAAEQRVEQHRRALADALAVDPDTTWPQLIQHARAYVRHTDEWRTIAVRRRERAEQAAAERDRYRAAWQSARQGRAEQRTLAERAEPEVITDRATIRAALAEPEQEQPR